MISCAALIIGLHLVSHHTLELPGQNNQNFGAYAECDGWTAGAYRNTMARTSVYGGYTWHWGPFSLTAGGITGYKGRDVYGQQACRPGYTDTPERWCWLREGGTDAVVQPFIAPAVAIGPARITYLPKINQQASAVVHLSVQHKF